MFDDPRSGRPCKLSEGQRHGAVERVKQSPRSLKNVLAQLAGELGIKLSGSTLKRICRRAKYCWKRVRKSLRSKRDPELFEQSRQKLSALIAQAGQQQIDLYYFDQSGFTLEPCVPYAWQPVGETLEVPCSKSKRLNVQAAILILANSPGFRLLGCRFLEAFQHEIHQGIPTVKAQVAG